MTTWHRYLYRAGMAEFRYVGEVLGSSEVWIGFELPFDADMTEFQLIRADKMTGDAAAGIGVTRWRQLDVPPPSAGDGDLRRMLLRVAAIVARRERKDAEEARRKSEVRLRGERRSEQAEPALHPRFQHPRRAYPLLTPFQVSVVEPPQELELLSEELCERDHT